jgi:ABC-type phosphate transport system substrate-binding protein
MKFRWGILFGLFLWGTVVSTARAEDLVVVVHPQAPVDHLSDAQLRQVYLGESSFWGPVKIHPAVLRVPPQVYAAFMGAVAGISPGGYEAYWIRKVFREGGMPPRPFDSAADLITYVANTPGGLGFIRRSDLRGASVKVAAHLQTDTTVIRKH